MELIKGGLLTTASFMLAIFCGIRYSDYNGLSPCVNVWQADYDGIVKTEAKLKSESKEPLSLYEDFDHARHGSFRSTWPNDQNPAIFNGELTEISTFNGLLGKAKDLAKEIDYIENRPSISERLKYDTEIYFKKMVEKKYSSMEERLVHENVAKNKKELESILPDLKIRTEAIRNCYARNSKMAGWGLLGSIFFGFVGAIATLGGLVGGPYSPSSEEEGRNYK
jgi:hypothetical protein